LGCFVYIRWQPDAQKGGDGDDVSYRLLAYVHIVSHILREKQCEDYATYGGQIKMRWMKHMNDVSRDEKLTKLLLLGGHEAYGFYWHLMEIIASHIEDISDISVTLPERTWVGLLCISMRKFQNLLETCAKCEVIFTKTYPDTSPKMRLIGSIYLFSIADKYTKAKASLKNESPKTVQRLSRDCPEVWPKCSTRLDKIRLDKSRADDISKISNTSSIEESKEDTKLESLFRDIIKSWPADRVGDINAAREIFADLFPQGLPQEEASERLKNIEKWARVELGHESQYVRRLDRWLTGLDASIPPPEEKKQSEWVPVEEVGAE